MKYLFSYIKNSGKAIIVVVAFSGCFQHYYKGSVKATESPAQKGSVIDSLTKQDKYFILRNGNQAYNMKGISVSADHETIKAVLDTLAAEHFMYLNKDRDRVMRYIQRNRQDLKVFSEVHVCIASDSSITNGDYVLQSGNIQKIELIRVNNAKTLTSHLLGFGLIAVALYLFKVIAVNSMSFGRPF